MAISPGGRPADDSPVGTPGGKANWVDKAGGLPKYVREIAHALIRKGMPESRAIATAVEHLRRLAATSTNPKVKAAAVAALAEWEAKRGAAHVSLSAVDPRVGHVDVTAMLDLSTPTLEDETVDLAPGTGHPPYHWKHGYIPLTPDAALSKAHGRRSSAEKIKLGTPKTPGTRSSGPTARPKAVAGAKPTGVDALAHPQEAQRRMVRSLTDAELRKEVARKSNKPATRSLAQEELGRRAKARDDEARGRGIPGAAEPGPKPPTPPRTPAKAPASSPDHAAAFAENRKAARTPGLDHAELAKHDAAAEAHVKAAEKAGKPFDPIEVDEQVRASMYGPDGKLRDPAARAQAVKNHEAQAAVHDSRGNAEGAAYHRAQADQYRDAPAKEAPHANTPGSVADRINQRTQADVARRAAPDHVGRGAANAHADAQAAGRAGETRAADQAAQRRAIERQDYANADGPALADEAARRGIIGRERAGQKSDSELRTMLRNHDENSHASHEDNARARAAKPSLRDAIGGDTSPLDRAPAPRSAPKVPDEATLSRKTHDQLKRSLGQHQGAGRKAHAAAVQAELDRRNAAGKGPRVNVGGRMVASDHPDAVAARNGNGPAADAPDAPSSSTSSTNPDAPIRVEHTPDGTLVHGTSRDDAPDLKAAGFKWSRNLGAWYLPRTWGESTRDQRVKQLEAKLGDRVGVDRTSGPRKSAAEREAETRARAGERATRMDDRAGKAQAEADARFKASHDATAGIPFGQPILVGHHSQRRHENAIEKSRANMGKGIEAQKAAEDATAAAERARRTAAGTESPVTVGNRIKRNEADLRDVERKLAGTSSALSGPATGDYKTRLEARRAELTDAIAHDRSKGGPGHSRETVKPGDVVHIGGHPHVVLKANAKTVTVPSIVGGSWTDTAPYHGITKHTPAADLKPETLDKLAAEHPHEGVRKVLAKVAADRRKADAPAAQADVAKAEQAGTGRSITPDTARRMSDAQLEDALTRLSAGGSPPAAMKAIEDELDRRDRERAAGKAPRR